MCKGIEPQSRGFYFSLTKWFFLYAFTHTHFVWVIVIHFFSTLFSCLTLSHSEWFGSKLALNATLFAGFFQFAASDDEKKTHRKKSIHNFKNQTIVCWIRYIRLLVSHAHSHYLKEPHAFSFLIWSRNFPWWSFSSSSSSPPHTVIVLRQIVVFLLFSRCG